MGAWNGRNPRLWNRSLLVAAVRNGKANRKAVLHLLGGNLDIEWNEKNDRVYMTGEAVTVFEGEWNNNI